MFVKIFRIIRTTISIAIIFFVLGCIASIISSAVDYAVLNGFRMQALDLLTEKIADNEKLNAITALHTAIQYMEMAVYDSAVRQSVILAVLLWFYCFAAIKGMRVNERRVIYFYTAGLGLFIAKKLVSFKKNFSFWALCVFSAFLPLIIPCLLAFTVLLATWIVNLVLAPVIYILSSYIITLTAER